MKGNKLIVGALVAALAAVTGCTLTIDFDPRGTSVSLDGYWTIDGFDATAAECDAAGIAAVQLIFWDGGTEYIYDEFRFDCALGGFDTRPQGVLEHGRFQTQWAAIGFDGQEIDGARSPMLLLDVSSLSVTHAELAPVNFETVAPVFDPRGDVGSLGATWTINGAAPTAAACDAGGITTMAFAFFDMADTARTDGVVVAMAPCTAGSYDSRPMALLDAGSYLVSVIAQDSAGGEVAAFNSTEPFVVGAAMHYNIQAVDFEVTLPNVMTINMSWMGDASDADCATAGVDSIFWELRDGTGTVVDTDTQTCAEIADVLAWTDLAADTYTLFVDAESADRTIKWNGTHETLTHAAATTEYNCFFDKM